MSIRRPTFFNKVLLTLKQLSTTRGFSIKQISEHLQQMGVKRNIKEIKLIVEKSLQYGVKNKLLLEKNGKFHLTASRLQSLQVKTASEKQNKKHVRFKKGKTNINDKLNKSKKRRSVRKQKCQEILKKSVKSTRTKNSRTSTTKQSIKNKRGSRSKKGTNDKNTETPSESEQTTVTNNRERSPSIKKSKTELIIKNEENKEPLDVTPDKDVHDNCVNKNQDRGKQIIFMEPPHLESDSETGCEPRRPPTKLIRKTTPSRHLSKVRKDLKYKYKHHCPHVVERQKRLRDLIPDDKSYRKYKSRSRHSYNHAYTDEESSDYDSNAKKKHSRKCHHHKSNNRHHHERHYNSDDYLLERKISNTILDHLNISNRVVEAKKENFTPFEVFLEANHDKLETIPENMSVDDAAEEVKNKNDNHFDTSYIN